MQSDHLAGYAVLDGFCLSHVLKPLLNAGATMQQSDTPKKEAWFTCKIFLFCFSIACMFLCSETRYLESVLK